MTSPENTVFRKLLESLSGVLAQVGKPVDVLRTILEQAVTRTHADRGVFVELGKGGEADLRVLHRFDPAALAAGARSYSRAIFAEVLRTGQPVLIENAMDDARFDASDSVQQLNVLSVLSMPILSGGDIAALVHLERDESGHFTAADRELLGSLLEVAAPLLETLRTGRRMLEESSQLRDAARLAREELAESREAQARDWSFGRFLGRSKEVRRLEEEARRVAATDFPVLIEGETGTGKSLLARILHHLGPRSSQAFVTVFCPSLEAGMVEDALFGHRRGAFTGAVSDRVGKIQAAQRGTLFLDEVGELPLGIQPKLLRLLHERTYERVGDHEERKADMRVIAATNRDLAAEVAAGRFRRDLYERLRFVALRIPPLRERREDIPRLLRHALDQHDSGRWIDVADDAVPLLVEGTHSWPGNVREIEQLAARLVLERSGERVTRDDLQRHLQPFVEHRHGSGETADATAAGGLPELVDSAERTLLETALRQNPHLSRAQLAAKLRISERSLYKKLRVFGLGG